MKVAIYNEDVQTFKNVATDPGFERIKYLIEPDAKDPQFSWVIFEPSYPEQINLILLLMLHTGKRIAYKQLDVA